MWRVALQRCTKLPLVLMVGYLAVAVAWPGTRFPASSADEQDTASAATVGGPVPEEERFTCTT